MRKQKPRTYQNFFDVGTLAQVNGASSTATKRTNHEDARDVTGFRLPLLNSLLHVGNKQVLVLVA